MIDRASSAGKRGGREPAEDMSERSVQPCSALAEAATIRWKVLMPLSFSDVSLLLCGQQAAALEEGLRAQVTGELSKHQRGWAWQHRDPLLGGLQEGKGKSSACKLYTIDLETEGWSCMICIIVCISQVTCTRYADSTYSREPYGLLV